MEREELRSIIESLLFVAEGPLTIQRLGEVLEDVDKDDIRTAIEEIQVELENNRRGVRLVEVAGGYQLADREGQCRLGEEASWRTPGAHGPRDPGNFGDHRV